MSDYQNSWDEKYAAQRRRDHANIEAMQNLIIQRITEETGIMMPPKVRAFISALQSAHGGGKVAGAPFTRSHLSIAQYLQFTGTDVAREARVRRILNSLIEYQERVGYELIHVKRGGELITAEDGSQSHTATQYTDNLKPVADAGVVRARASELSKHPGMAMSAQVDWAMSKLIRFNPKAEEEEETQMDLRNYANSQHGRIEKSAIKVADAISARGGNGIVWMRQLAKQLLHDAEQMTSGATNLLPREAEKAPENLEEKPDMLAAALDYVNFDDAPVFPVKADKSPLTPNGFKDATRDEATVRLLWRKHPDAGIGIPTGEASGWLVLDIDPRHGGDAALTTLIEQYGDGWLETMQARTGGGGHHIIFANPPGSNIRNSAGRVGEGIDVRGKGGYIVVAPSIHASGRCYEWLNNLKPAQPPEWLLKLLTEERGASTSQTQPRASSSASIGAVIPDGERNVSLFKIASSLRGKGAECAEIEAELLRINRERCAPPLPDSEVLKIARSAAKLAANRVAIGA